MNDDERFAAIGRAVVRYCMGDNPQAEREATPDRVVEFLRRRDEELRSLQTCDALRVGRHAIALADLLVPKAKP
jgi:hypothetical protein